MNFVLVEYSILQEDPELPNNGIATNLNDVRINLVLEVHKISYGNDGNRPSSMSNDLTIVPKEELVH
jgi:hypothetical protein